MAFFDAVSGEIVARIVYDGLGTAGKTTNVRMLHDAFASRATSAIVAPEVSPTGRTLYFDWLELLAGHLDDRPLRCQIVTVPGQFVYGGRRYQLLREIDGVVLVCDSTPHGAEAARIAAAFLTSALESSGNREAPIVVQANKQDLPNALSPEEVAAHVGIDAAAVVGASARTGDGVRLTLLRILDLARGRIRSQCAGRGPEVLPPRTQTAEQLYEELRTMEHQGPSEAAAAALDRALAQLK